MVLAFKLVCVVALLESIDLLRRRQQKHCNFRPNIEKTKTKTQKSEIWFFSSSRFLLSFADRLLRFEFALRVACSCKLQAGSERKRGWVAQLAQSFVLEKSRLTLQARASAETDFISFGKLFALHCANNANCLPASLQFARPKSKQLCAAAKLVAFCKCQKCNCSLRLLRV